MLGVSAKELGEFTVFTGIAVSSIAFGVLVLTVRKRLEKLTHAVEDEEHEIIPEQEKFELANPKITHKN